MERIGVYVCHCGTNISDTVDVLKVANFAQGLTGVVIARTYEYMCSDPGQELIKQDIAGLFLTRVVVASCSPLMHEATFRETCSSAGLNPYYVQVANIREHVSWVTDDPEKATLKAMGLVAGAVRRIFHHEPLEIKKVPVIKSALVIGGGIAGIEAAVNLADSGTEVILVEKEPSIGGHMAMFDKTFPTLDCAACILTPKMVSAGHNRNIELLTYSEVESASGYVGNFSVKISRKARFVNEELCNGCGLCIEKCPVKNIPSEFDLGLGSRKAIYIPFAQAVPRVPVIDSDHCRFLLEGKCGVCRKVCPRNAIDFEQKDQLVERNAGAVIVATGFDVFDAKRLPEYGYGRFDNVYSSMEIERLCHGGGPTGGKIQLKDGRTPGSVAILHCIGSRDKRCNEYCSRVCCMYSLKFAHLLKEKTGARVYNLYIDMRAFGKGYEEFYRRLLEEGTVFIRGKGAEVTDIAETADEKNKLVVICEDTLLGEVRRLPVDMVILSSGLEKSSKSENIARLFNLSYSGDGFFREAHPKLRPVDSPVDGIFLAGACQGPKDIPDSVAQGAAAAARALTLIDTGEVQVESSIATVNNERCSLCGECIIACPYDALEMVENRLVVIETLCKGCGVCAGHCLPGAIDLLHYTDEQLVAEMKGLLHME